MAVCPTYKIDSNVAGLRYAEEVCLKQLPTLAADGHDPIWIAAEANSFSDFGGQTTTVARNPINPTRQRKKGVVTDLDASGGFQQDLTFFNTTSLLQGFMFADIREKKTTKPVNGDDIAVTAVDSATKTYTTAAGGGTGFAAGDVVLAEGFGVSANNGPKTVASATGTTVVISEALVNEAAPPAGASLTKIGVQFGPGIASIVMNGQLVRLTISAGDFTTMGLLPGEWVFVGGDDPTTQFTDNAPGVARIRNIAATYLEFDKVDWASPIADAGAAKAIRVFFGAIIRNEPNPADIVRRSYQLERTLGQDASGTMSEYLVGAVPSELTLNVTQADKVTVDMTFVACDHQIRNGATGVKPGTRVSLGPADADAYNASNNVVRVKLASVTDDADVVPLFAFSQDFTLTINNNLSPNKAVGVLGAFDISAGTFEVGGSLNAYFASAESVQAVRNNEDITIDVFFVAENRGVLYDVPLLGLGNGRLNVEQDQPIMIPLDTSAAESMFGYTLLWMFFPYLPDVAGAQ